MKLIFLIFISLVIFCCRSKSNNNSGEQKDTDGLMTKSQQDSVLYIDSLKWMLYAVNYYGKALFADSANGRKLKIRPVECEVRLERYKYINDDSLYYRFTFVKNKLAFLYIDDKAFIEGFEIRNKVKYPIARHIRFDFENNVDSVSAYLAKSDSMFREYLKSYKGDISFWLKEEAKRRNVLQ